MGGVDIDTGALTRTGLERAQWFLDYPLVKLGQSSFTLGKILYFVILVILLLWVTRLIKKWLLNRVLTKSQMDLGARQATTTLIGYAVLFIGLMVILQTVGIDLTTLNVIAGAIGVGIGLGLQSIANNFISGLIILFERPIKVGDRIVVDDVNGKVVDIRARSTTVLTNENIAIIIPNSKFITENVINWSYNDPKIRFHVPVGVAYGSNPRLVEKALLEAARSFPDVLDDPEPGVWFLRFGDSALEFELRAWTSESLHNETGFRSRLNYAIHDKLEEHGLHVPFPQRDLHVRSGTLAIRMEQGETERE